MKIVITLDYEMFLNDIVGTVENTLIRPTNRMLDICKEHNIRMTVFVDASYLYRLRELYSIYPKLRDDFEMVAANIRKIVAYGHDVQLHLHPQWYYCTYDGKKWIMDWSHYKLSDIEPSRAFSLFKDSKELLESIVGYKLTAFRAGGYSIQDFDYEKCFNENGIKIDSSVLSGCKYHSDTHSYDYTKCPKTIYNFNALETLCEDGFFKEVPISTKEYNFFRYILLKKIRQKGCTPKYGDGGDLPERIRADRFMKIKQCFGRPMHVSATFDWLMYNFVEDVIKDYTRYGVATIISHPKNVSPSSLEYMNKFIKCHLSVGDHFVTIKDLH